jgi:hypothetical protein
MTAPAIQWTPGTDNSLVDRFADWFSAAGEACVEEEEQTIGAPTVRFGRARTGAAEGDVILDSPLALSRRLDNLRARGFQRRNDPRNR